MGNMNFERALCKLGACVSLMPLSVWKKLDMGEIRPIDISLHLVDRTIKYPMSVLEEVPIRINEFYIPMDFVIHNPLGVVRAYLMRILNWFIHYVLREILNSFYFRIWIPKNMSMLVSKRKGSIDVIMIWKDMYQCLNSIVARRSPWQGESLSTEKPCLDFACHKSGWHTLLSTFHNYMYILLLSFFSFITSYTLNLESFHFSTIFTLSYPYILKQWLLLAWRNNLHFHLMLIFKGPSLSTITHMV